MKDEKNRPVAVCSDCITYSFDMRDINTPCRVQRGKRTCAGIYADTTDPVNWKECTACGGTGEAWDGDSCTACQQSGWLLSRRRS